MNRQILLETRDTPLLGKCATDTTHTMCIERPFPPYAKRLHSIFFNKWPACNIRSPVTYKLWSVRGGCAIVSTVGQAGSLFVLALCVRQWHFSCNWCFICRWLQLYVCALDVERLQQQCKKMPRPIRLCLCLSHAMVAVFMAINTHLRPYSSRHRLQSLPSHDSFKIWLRIIKWFTEKLARKETIQFVIIFVHLLAAFCCLSIHALFCSGHSTAKFVQHFEILFGTLLQIVPSCKFQHCYAVWYARTTWNGVESDMHIIRTNRTSLSLALIHASGHTTVQRVVLDASLIVILPLSTQSDHSVFGVRRFFTAHRITSPNVQHQVITFFGSLLLLTKHSSPVFLKNNNRMQIGWA